MTTVSRVLSQLEIFAPARWTQLVHPKDNVGLLVGHEHAPVSRVLVALDVSDRIAGEAVRSGAQLIVTHHPVIYGSGLRAIVDTTPGGRLLLSLIENNIAVICMHTNWDAAPGGVNDLLARVVGLEGELGFLGSSYTDPDGRRFGLGRVGYLPAPLSAEELADTVRAALGCRHVRYVDGGRPCRFVAVGSGNSTSQWSDVIAHGCDAFITGDVGYHLNQEAHLACVTLIDAGHFPTERIIVKPVVTFLQERLPDVEVLESDTEDEPTQWI